MNCPSLTELPPAPPGRVGWPWTEESPRLSACNVAWPRVTVVTPSYNQAPFVEETIRSVLLQGYPDLEYIIIDGGSADGSAEIIHKYEPWIAHWVSEPDGGQSDALNKGFRRASGEYVGWMNSDDTYEPGAIRSAAAQLRYHPEVAVVYSDCNVIDEASQITGRVCSRDFRLEDYLLQDFVPNQTALIRREALLRVGGIDPDLNYHMDYDLFLRLGRFHQLQRLPGTGGNFRVCNGTKSVGHSMRFSREGITILDKFFAEPTLPGDLRVLRGQAYARAHLHGACREYAGGHFASARWDIDRSVALDPQWWSDWRNPAALFCGWARYPVTGDPLRYIMNVYSHLPESAQSLVRQKRKAVSEAAMGLFSDAHRDGDPGAVRRALVVGVAKDARWLVNRGVLSIAAESVLGSRMAEWARALLRKAER